MKLPGLICVLAAANLLLVEGFENASGFKLNHAAHARHPVYEESPEFIRWKYRNEPLPAEINFVESGYVSPVKDQGMCKASWAIAATGVLEGAYAKATGRKGKAIQQFSEQMIISCANQVNSPDPESNWDSLGCQGGSPVVAMEFTKEQGWNCFTRSLGFQSADGQAGICRLDQFVSMLKYISWRKYCSEFQFKKDMAMGGTRFNNLSIYKGPGLVNSTRLKQMLVVLGPVAVAIDGSRLFYYDPSKGHFSDCSSSEDALSYVLLLVGYGTDSFGDYWLLKASYGETFGIDGYVKLPRGTDRNGNDLNSCGLLHHPFGMSVDAYTES
eukprot:CAMPEP_0203754538 /NCGR_PEP_ID=MMETSP0098-20131031/8130_1 /ASSEMBLY_ACC=CAM_ASM_000208 /TAXON_ID=96639 /ORGANISM=" , Strain NY0313808BC1" /LENGTH=326 /DNA_ID=CAMNT_0050645611 /DNA_START=17 /DNA_END=997 /DNA_ORIENTATION=+